MFSPVITGVLEGPAKLTLLASLNPGFQLRNRKHVPCFCRVTETQVEVLIIFLNNKKIYGQILKTNFNYNK